MKVLISGSWEESIRYILIWIVVIAFAAFYAIACHPVPTELLSWR